MRKFIIATALVSITAVPAFAAKVSNSGMSVNEGMYSSTVNRPSNPPSNPTRPSTTPPAPPSLPSLPAPPSRPAP